MSLIEYEGRQIELPNEITANDEKLLEVLLPYFPELSSATIERKTGQPINPHSADVCVIFLSVVKSWSQKVFPFNLCGFNVTDTCQISRNQLN